jgi:hypothetical protein
VNVEGAVNNFKDDGRVLDRGGVMVLRTRGVRGGGILSAAVGLSYNSAQGLCAHGHQKHEIPLLFQKELSS